MNISALDKRFGPPVSDAAKTWLSRRVADVVPAILKAPFQISCCLRPRAGACALIL